MYSLSMKRLRFIGDPGRKAEMTASELVEIKRNIPMRPVLSIPTLALMDTSNCPGHQSQQIFLLGYQE